jgi:hypothetical protein
MRELTERFRRDVFVRSPRRGRLTKVLTGMGATVLAEPGGGLSVTGMDALSTWVTGRRGWSVLRWAPGLCRSWRWRVRTWCRRQ